MIIQTHLQHGVIYHYQCNTTRLKKEKNQKNFYEYCLGVIQNCPHEYFFSGPRSSVLKFRVGVDPVHVKGHEMSEFAKLGLEEYSQNIRSNHEKVQQFLLLHDPKTVALEVPLWVEQKETLPFIDGNLTGHIDIIRVENENLWIWDYKPNAKKEKYATTQTYYYALMLAKRCQIPLDKIRCGYFDVDDAFLFKPVDVNLNGQLDGFVAAQEPRRTFIKQEQK